MAVPAVQTWEWTADAFELAGENGLFGDDAHAELIDGRVTVMSPQSPAHAYALQVLLRALAGLGPQWTARTQSPVRLANDTEPEPDICVALGPYELYANRHPGPQDISLLIEVSSSSLGFDIGHKIPAYARSSVPEVWVVDIAHRQVLMYSSPEPDQAVYAHVETRTSGTITAYGLEVEVDRLWPASS